MDIKKLKELLTEEQIIQLVISLGADIRTGSNDNEVWFRTICHGGDSHKLYFYRDSKEFHCYSNCGQMDIITLVQKVKNFTISEAISFICNTFGFGNYSMVEGLFDTPTTSIDLEILSRYEGEPKQVDMTREFKYVTEEILERFYKYYHPSFYEDGISIQTLYKFGIKYDILNRRVIIPHRDELGGLVAIRCRNIDEEMVEAGFKYMPITVDGKLLSAKTSKYLYGLYYNKENIKKLKRVILLESEKAVMQLDTILEGNNIGLSLMSSSLSLIQVELLKELGVEEVIVALDKEYEEYGTKEEKAYAMKIRKGIINKLLPYFTVSVIWDRDNTLGLKESPTDKGAEVFHKLFRERIKVQ